VALALRNYQEEHGRLPPAVVYGEDGAPLHSWRVLILPYLSHEALYQEFRLDEPWDSPHNIRLLSRMPSSYAPPRGKAYQVPAYHTVVHVFVGEGAAFEGPEGLRLPQDFPDGTCNTLLVVEAGEPVPWTKPEDLPYAPDRPLPALRSLFKDGFRACTADCSRHFVPRGTSEATLRAAITRNGGDTLGRDW
jgi:Protein of unknown function (DUF1559)